MSRFQTQSPGRASPTNARTRKPPRRGKEPVIGSRIDPTRTVTLRKAFERELNRMFARLLLDIVDAVERDDAFGLGPPPPGVPLAVAPSLRLAVDPARAEGDPLANVFCATGEGGGIDPSCSPGGKKGGKVGYGPLKKYEEINNWDEAISWGRKVPTKVADAVREYQYVSHIADGLNRGLQQGKVLSEREQKVDDAFTHLRDNGHFNARGTVMRGISHARDDLQPGAIYSPKDWGSTSTELEVAQRFAMTGGSGGAIGGKPTILRFKTERGLVIPGNENEILLAKGDNYRVVAREVQSVKANTWSDDKVDITVIDLEPYHQTHNTVSGTWIVLPTFPPGDQYGNDLYAVENAILRDAIGRFARTAGGGVRRAGHLAVGKTVETVKGGVAAGKALYEKVSDRIKAETNLVQRGYRKATPERLQQVLGAAHAAYKAIEKPLDAGYHLAQKAALAIAKEKGLPPERVERLGHVLGMVDGALRWTANVPLAHEAIHTLAHVGGPVAFLGAKAAFFVPVGSLAYVASAAVTNPGAVISAARKKVRKLLGKGEPGSTARPDSSTQRPGTPHAQQPGGSRQYRPTLEGLPARNAVTSYSESSYHVGYTTAPTSQNPVTPYSVAPEPSLPVVANLSADDSRRIFEAVEDHGWDPDYEVLLVAAADETGGDLDRALAVADRAWREERATRNVFRPTANATGLDFRFRTDPEKLKAFGLWLRQQAGVRLRGVSEEALWRKYIQDGFKKGAGRAFDDTKSMTRKKTQEKGPEWYKGGKEQFLQDSFAHPVSQEKLEYLVSRVFTDLDSVTEQMAAGMTRILADGLVRGQSPREVAKTLSSSLDLAKGRALSIAQTELMRAHAEGQLTALENLGVEEVGVSVEWSVVSRPDGTPDERVCPLCRPLQGVVLKLTEARGMLPRHPRCRCAWRPAGLGEDETGQKRTKARILRAIQASRAAERKKGETATSSQRSSAAALEQGGEWGPSVPISKIRPQSLVGNAPPLPPGALPDLERVEAALNVFCPTGEGGGVKPTCSPKGKSHIPGGSSTSRGQPSPVSPREKYVGQTVGASEHAHAAGSARSLARALGGVTEAETADAGQKDKKPYDVRVPKADGSGDHDLEVKTLLKGTKQELSVHDDALLRKIRHAEANPGNTFHTVARDDRDRYGGGAYAANYSGHGLYYKRGSGRYRLSQMHKCRDEAELKALLDTPDDQLPEKARGSLPPPPPVASLEAKAQKAHAQRYARDRARKDRNREKLREQARAQRMARRGARAGADAPGATAGPA